MALSIIERMALGREFASLMAQSVGAAALTRIRIGKDIFSVMTRLGLKGAVPAKPEPEPETPAVEEVPQVVADFLAGAFVADSQTLFIDRLRAVSEFAGRFLTVSQAAEQTERWIDHNQYVQAH